MDKGISRLNSKTGVMIQQIFFSQIALSLINKVRQTSSQEVNQNKKKKRGLEKENKTYQLTITRKYIIIKVFFKIFKGINKPKAVF